MTSSTPLPTPMPNLFDDAHAPAQGERFETLLAHRNLLTRIQIKKELLTLAR